MNRFVRVKVTTTNTNYVGLVGKVLPDVVGQQLIHVEFWHNGTRLSSAYRPSELEPVTDPAELVLTALVFS